MPMTSLGDRHWVIQKPQVNSQKVLLQISFVTSVYTCRYAFATGHPLIVENRVSNWLYLNIIIIWLLGSLRN